MAGRLPRLEVVDALQIALAPPLLAPGATEGPDASGNALHELLRRQHRHSCPAEEILDVPGDDRLRSVAIRLSREGRISQGHASSDIPADVVRIRTEPRTGGTVARAERVQNSDRINGNETMRPSLGLLRRQPEGSRAANLKESQQRNYCGNSRHRNAWGAGYAASRRKKRSMINRLLSRKTKPIALRRAIHLLPGLVGKGSRYLARDPFEVTTRDGFGLSPQARDSRLDLTLKAAVDRIGKHHAYARSGSGIDKVRQILAASRLAISLCRGTASTAPVAGLHPEECVPPSRFRWQP
jgi:hypothetical protein